MPAFSYEGGDDINVWTKRCLSLTKKRSRLVGI